MKALLEHGNCKGDYLSKAGLPNIRIWKPFRLGETKVFNTMADARDYASRHDLNAKAIPVVKVLS